MRKSGNKKKEISKSKRLMAVCLSMTFILGSMSYLAFADENDEEIPSDDPVIEEVAPAAEEAVAEEETVDEEEAAEAADAEEAVEEEPEAVTEIEEITETEEVSISAANASVGTIYYVGSNTERSNNVWYKYNGYTGQPFRFGGSKMPVPTFSNGNWTFAGVYYNGGSLSMPGSADAKPIGLEIVSGSGTQNNPFVIQFVFHTHSFVLSAEDNVASVKCTAPVCYDYETDVEYEVTLEADDTVYTGEAVEATATVDDGFPTEVTVGDVKYVGSGDTSYAETTTAPTDAGTYSASVTITLGESSATATVDFEIDKADASIEEYPVIIAEDYDEEVFITDSPVDLIVEAGVADGGTLLYSLDGENFSEELPKATEPGEYYVYIYVKGDSNHYDTTVVHSWPLYIVNYAFTEGADATWDKDADKDKTLTFTIKRSRLDDQTYGNVEKVYVDGEELNDSSYNLEEGSAIVTLSADYLKTLADGKHTLKVDFSDPYSVETNFSITSPSAAPQTGEYAGAFVLVIGAVMAAAGAAFVIKAKKA